MNTKDLQRVIKLRLKTVSDVAQYLKCMKKNANELQVLSSITNR